jgi:hypothetical protein
LITLKKLLQIVLLREELKAFHIIWKVRLVLHWQFSLWNF